MTKQPDKDDQFTPEETQRRVEAALRGARIAGAKHKPAPKRDSEGGAPEGDAKPSKEDR